MPPSSRKLTLGSWALGLGRGWGLELEEVRLLQGKRKTSRLSFLKPYTAFFYKPNNSCVAEKTSSCAQPDAGRTAPTRPHDNIELLGHCGAAWAGAGGRAKSKGYKPRSHSAAASVSGAKAN